MKPAQEFILQILSDLKFIKLPFDSDQFGSFAAVKAGKLNPEAQAQAFVDITFAASCFQFLQDQRWLQVQKGKSLEVEFKEYIGTSFLQELSSLEYLEEIVKVSTVAELKHICEKLKLLEQVLIREALKGDEFTKRVFVSAGLKLMAGLLSEQENVSLYRTFDGMDQVLGLDYGADLGMKAELHMTERLYEGAGVGVQSSYSTLFTALREIAPSHGSRFIDLGSGYGRAGFVVGALRPDIEFIGYEYVPHRVDIANVSSQMMGFQSHVQFLTQDLSLVDFQIPAAEVYYMFDPFSKETYQSVLDQLIQISRRQPITIATKGNARLWLREVAAREGWSQSEEFDGGNLCLFRSAAGS